MQLLFILDVLIVVQLNLRYSIFHLKNHHHALRPVHTGMNIGARYSPAFFNAFFCVHTQSIFADDEPSEQAN